MLKYLEAGLSHGEVPGEECLCIYISGCRMRCPNCHYPELQDPDSGDLLADNFDDILNLFGSLATCVCFMGEGSETAETLNELQKLAAQCNERKLKTCLYSGRDCEIEPWMSAFDYIKLGGFHEELGPLLEKTTNQRLYKKSRDSYIDITASFWEAP